MGELTPEIRRLYQRAAALEAQCEALGEPPAGTFGAYLLQELHTLWNRLEVEALEAEFGPKPYLWPDDEPFPWSSLREFTEEMRAAHTGLAGTLEGVRTAHTGGADPLEARFAQAQDPTAPAEELRALAEDPVFIVRFLVARNPATPPSVLARLLHDEHGRVARTAAANPHTPPEALREALQDPTTRKKALSSGTLGRLGTLPEDPSLWLALWGAADESGRRRIRSHPYGAQVAVMAGLAGLGKAGEGEGEGPF